MSASPAIEVRNEWDLLTEVIVGIVPDDVRIPPPSYSIIRYNSPQTVALLREHAGKSAAEVNPEGLEQTRSQVEALVATYQQHGVTVHRGRPWTADEEGFLAHVAPGGWPLYARDPMLVVGRNVIELGIMMPMRRKEIFAFRDILQERVAADPDVQYVSMPQPVPYRITEDMPEGPGPFLEGGDIFVLEKDVLVGNSGLASNRAGIDWLQRYLGPQGYTVHEVPLTGEWLHLDCVFAIVRRGLVMADLSAFPAGLPAPVKEWDVIAATSAEAHVLGCNTICLRENTVLIGAEHERLIGELQRHGATVVATPMDVASRWGGGIRCASHPLHRQS